MAMGVSGSGGGLASDINITPMIDVLLVLLIIFMVVQPMSRRAFIAQVPPEQRERRPQQQQQSGQIVLELLPDGGYAINKQPYVKAQLEAAFHGIYDERPNKLLFVKAAATRTYGEVVEAMDIARGAGVQVIGFTPGDQQQQQAR